MDLSQVRSTELLIELASRKGVERTSSGMFAPYEVVRKYDANGRQPVTADVVLIIRDLNHLDT